MGWFKKMLGLEDSPLTIQGDLEKAVTLISLKDVNEKRLVKLKDRLVMLGEEVKRLRERGIPIPPDLVEFITHTERNLGIELHDLAKKEEIQRHDISSAERNVESALSLIEQIKQRARHAA
jgi:hypothetical protein